MARYRYLIERNSDEYAPFWLATVDTEGESSGGSSYATIAAAKEMAQKSEGEVVVKWKTPPAAWQPDALYVSQFFDDGVEENRDR